MHGHHATTGEEMQVTTLGFSSKTFLYNGEPVHRFLRSCSFVGACPLYESPYSPGRDLRDKIISVVSQALLNN